jgi:hypothetical protein
VYLNQHEKIGLIGQSTPTSTPYILEKLDKRHHL